MTELEKTVRIGGPIAREDNFREVFASRQLVMTALCVSAWLFLLVGTAAARWNPSLPSIPLGTDGVVLVLASLAWSAWSVFYLRTRPSVAQMRRLDVIRLVLLGATLTYWQVAEMVTLSRSTFEGPFHRLFATRFTYLQMSLAWTSALISYGLIVPNTARRAAAILLPVATIPVVAILASGLVYGSELTETATSTLAMLTMMVASCGVAVYGSGRIDKLRREAVEARREVRELGQYRLTKRLGGGGMGEVFLAEHRLLKRACAVKLIRPEHAGDLDYRQRFEREVQACAGLTHPNTVEVYDYGESADGTLYYAMEFVDGPSLDALVGRHGPLSPERAAYFLMQLCGALREAHGRGLVHRDIKPSNVLVRSCNPSDAVKLVDFGLVQPAVGSADAKLTSASVIVGSPEYLSPEQARGDATDARSDLYSLGAMGFYLVTGRPPFAGRVAIEAVMAHLNEPPPRASAVRPDVPADLTAVILRCMDKQPSNRFQTAEELAAGLAGCDCAGRWGETEATEWWHIHAAPK